MRTDQAIEKAVEDGLQYVASVQEVDGGFVSSTSPDPRKFIPQKTYKTTFISSIIACSLSNVEHNQAKTIIDKIAGFLTKQRSDNWSFNYWDRTSEEAARRPYPDDLDDTACALAALLHSNGKVFSGADLAKITQLLIAVEAQEGGPYYTWLVNENAEKHWRDVDIAVNANIAYFLKLIGVSLPGQTVYFAESLKKDRLKSPYYPSTHASLYFLCRVYNEQQLSCLYEKTKHLPYASPLEAATLLSSMVRLGRRNKTLVDYLLSTQRRDGSWPASGFCLDPALHGTTHYAGTSSLSTALSLEALSLYARQGKQTKHTARVDKHVKNTVQNIEKAIASLPGRELRRESQTRLKELMNEENAEMIIRVPWVMSRAAGLAVDESTLEKLALINVWGWLAYTIADDFIDEGGDPKQLPSAVMAHRELINAIYSALPNEQDFHAHANAILNILDGANAWEVARCRAKIRGTKITIESLPDYKDYSQLAERSLGHMISGVGVLYSGGHGQDAPMMHQLEKFFRHYLIARQLNDDARDWQDDLRYGHINTAAALILKKWPNPLGKTSYLGKILPKMQEVMWETVDGRMCQLIGEHLAQAKKAAAYFQNDSLGRLLVPLEKNLQKIIDEHQKTKDFIAHF